MRKTFSNKCLTPKQIGPNIRKEHIVNQDHLSKIPEGAKTCKFSNISSILLE